MRDEILKLRGEGKTFREIEKLLGCSKSTISYHCSEGQKNKTRERVKKYRSNHPLNKKLESFKSRKLLKCRCEKFQMRVASTVESRNGSVVKSMKDVNLIFDKYDVIDEFGENPVCYLSGREISWLDGSSYALDHIIPVSKGGDNSFSNLGLANPDVNIGKGSQTVEEFIQMCREVLEYNGYNVQPILTGV
jgi:hypothetical protein